MLRYGDTSVTLYLMTASSDQRVSANAAMSAVVTALREERGLSVDQLAVYAGLNRASLYRKLKGEAGWKLTDVEALTSYFHVQPNDLIYGPPSPLARAGGTRRRATATPDTGKEPRGATRRYSPAMAA